MAKPKKLVFAISDSVFGDDLSPSNLTLPLLKEFIDQVMTFLRGSEKPNLNEVKTEISKGSLAVVAENEAGILDRAYDDYASAAKNSDLDLIDSVRAGVIENWQLEAQKNKDRIYRVFVGDGEEKLEPLTISSESDFKPRKEAWVNVEHYLYGRVYDLGGKNKPNVHIELENGNTLKIEAKEALLSVDNENRLYKDQLVRVKAKRNIKTGQLRGERLLSFEYYEPIYREDEFEKISKQAKIAWRSVENVNEWVEKMRSNA